MDKLPLISIIIASYNHEKYVAECLSSILDEDYPEKEIVIINDGSKDKTDEEISSWIENNKDKIQVKYINRENRGLTRTINELIDMAEGEFLVLLASDDKLINNGIKRRYRYLLDNPEKMAVLGDCDVIDTEGNQILSSGFEDLFNSPKKNYINDKKIRREIISNFSVPGPTLMVRKNIYNLIGKYDESLSLEDFDFYLKTVSQNLLGFIDEKVSSYRRHANSIVVTDKFIDIQSSVRKIIKKNICLFSFNERLLLIKAYIFSFIYGNYLLIKHTLIKEYNKGNILLGFLLMLLYFVKNLVKKPLFWLKDNL